jgi:hypothetical protein
MSMTINSGPRGSANLEAASKVAALIGRWGPRGQPTAAAHVSLAVLLPDLRPQRRSGNIPEDIPHRQHVTAAPDHIEHKAGAESDAVQHAPSDRPATARPLFFMRGHPLPTVEQIVDLARDLTGREPTPEEIAECRRILDAARPAMQRTPEEQSIIDFVARSRGREWAEAHAESILTQARAAGDLPVRSSAEAEAVADQRAAFDTYRKNMHPRSPKAPDSA